jgi:hypothetical protein
MVCMKVGVDDMGDTHTFLVGNIQIVLDIPFGINNHHLLGCRAADAIGQAPKAFY